MCNRPEKASHTRAAVEVGGPPSPLGGARERLARTRMGVLLKRIGGELIRGDFNCRTPEFLEED